MNRVIANIVARNEADAYLEPVLKRLREQVDTIVFTDDASDDETVEVARQYVDHINILEEPLFSVHEGKLRQNSWGFLEREAQPVAGDWILAIDCDEMLYETNPLSLKGLAQLAPYDVVNVQFYHMWNETQYRIDKAWRPHGSNRFFRYQAGGSFKPSALACGSEPTYVEWNARHWPNRVLKNPALKMKHLSYIKDEDKKKKYDRYMQIDGGKFHSNAHILSIMDSTETIKLRDWEWD